MLRHDSLKKESNRRAYERKKEAWQAKGNVIRQVDNNKKYKMDYSQLKRTTEDTTQDLTNGGIHKEEVLFCVQTKDDNDTIKRHIREHVIRGPTQRPSPTHMALKNPSRLYPGAQLYVSWVPSGKTF